jgi:hypothetical protein
MGFLKPTLGMFTPAHDRLFDRPLRCKRTESGLHWNCFGWNCFGWNRFGWNRFGPELDVSRPLPPYV